MPLLVVGMPYRAWRQTGVIVDKHEGGMASDVRFATIVGGVVNDGGAEAMANLKWCKRPQRQDLRLEFATT